MATGGERSSSSGSESDSESARSSRRTARGGVALGGVTSTPARARAPPRRDASGPPRVRRRCGGGETRGSRRAWRRARRRPRRARRGLERRTREYSAWILVAARCSSAVAGGRRAPWSGSTRDWAGRRTMRAPRSVDSRRSRPASGKRRGSVSGPHESVRRGGRGFWDVGRGAGRRGRRGCGTGAHLKRDSFGARANVTASARRRARRRAAFSLPEVDAPNATRALALDFSGVPMAAPTRRLAPSSAERRGSPPERRTPWATPPKVICARACAQRLVTGPRHSRHHPARRARLHRAVSARLELLEIQPGAVPPRSRVGRNEPGETNLRSWVREDSTCRSFGENRAGT